MVNVGFLKRRTSRPEARSRSSIAITLDIYSHVIPTMQREAAAAMHELFGKVTA